MQELAQLSPLRASIGEISSNLASLAQATREITSERATNERSVAFAQIGVSFSLVLSVNKQVKVVNKTDQAKNDKQIVRNRYLLIQFTTNTTATMDPYELFSTPPSDIMISSTPTKARRPPISSTPNRAKNTPLKPSKSNKSLNKSLPNKTKRTPIAKKGKKTTKKKAENLWDKCLKSDPQLAQFVDKFNQSLEEALSKPLDISDND